MKSEELLSNSDDIYAIKIKDNQYENVSSINNKMNMFIIYLNVDILHWR